MPVSTPKPVEIPQVQFLIAFLPVLTLEPVEIPPVLFLVAFMPNLTPIPVEIPQVQFLAVVHARCGPTPVEIPQVQFLDKVYKSVFLVWCRWPDSAENPWRFHRCSSWTRFTCPSVQKTSGDSTGTVLGQGLHALLCRKPLEIPQVQFLDKVHMPFCAENQLENPQVQFLDMFDMPVVLHDSALVQICRKLWSSTVAVFDEVGVPVVVQRHVPWFAWQSSWTRLLPCPLLCASRVQTRRILYFTVAVLLQGVHVRRCAQTRRRWFRQSTKCLEVPPLQFGPLSVGPPGPFVGAPVSDRGVALTPGVSPRCQASGGCIN